LTLFGADPNFGQGAFVPRQPRAGGWVKRKKSKDPDMKKTVLVADDSPTIRKIVQLCLKEMQIEVVSASSGAEAI
jgi:PleD family two-component response regulator